MERIIDSVKSEIDESFDSSLRPIKLDDFVGQEAICKHLKVYISAAKTRGESLDHVLLYGPPGLGKTTLAFIIANEMGSKVHITNGPALEKVGDLASILSELNPGDVLFIDEIHRMPKILEESLYTAMEDFSFSITLSNMNSSKVLTIDLPPFTLIGATTRIGSLSSPLRTRFGITEQLQYYEVYELEKIVKRTSKVLNFSIDDESSKQIAMRSRGTPRVANRLFRRIRDFATFEGKQSIEKESCIDAFISLKVDSLGLDEVDLKYLKSLIYRYKGGPVGLNSLAYSIGEVSSNLEDVYEPYLLKIGFIDRTMKGRVCLDAAYQHLGIKRKYKK